MELIYFYFYDLFSHQKNLEHLYELLLVNFESAAHKLQWSG